MLQPLPPFLPVIYVWEGLLWHWLAQKLAERAPALADLKHQQPVSRHRLQGKKNRKLNIKWLLRQMIAVVIGALISQQLHASWQQSRACPEYLKRHSSLSAGIACKRIAAQV